MDRLYLVRYGEIGLKGANRRSFEKKLAENIRRSLRGIPDINVEDRRGRYFVSSPEEYGDQVETLLLRIPGIYSISPAHSCGKMLEEIYQEAIALMESERDFIHEQENARNPGEKISFKVETRRADKSYPLTSPEISNRVGGAVLKHVDGIEVDVHHPTIRLDIEIREKAYLFCRRLKGLGGLPYGSAGKALALLSGGIDSPVAAFQMISRGVELEAVHYHSFPFTSNRAAQKVEDLAKILTKFCGKLHVHSVNILPIQHAIKEHCPSQEMTILSRCFMMMLATRIAKERGCSALVTGESIGQVASQTMEGIVVTDSMTDLPVFRPLISVDKEDIIKTAKTIESYPISIQPFEDCCTVFLPDRVVTKPRLERIQASLSHLDVDALLDEALSNMETKRIK